MSDPNPLRILTITTLYPNVQQPSFGIFVENRLRHLAQAERANVHVVAPVPWFPFQSELFGRYGAYSRVPHTEVRYGISVTHPRYAVIPRFGMLLAPVLLAGALWRHVCSMLNAGYRFDLVDAHYFYPDGVAASWVARRLGLPVVITARGSDLNDYVPRFPLVRHMIRRTASQANGLITVCQALKDVLVELGIGSEQINVLRNGVDLETFKPLDRAVARQTLGTSGTTLASIGHLVPRKGHDIVIRATALLPDVTLLVVGDGPERARLQRLSGEIGVGDRVRFLGEIPHASLAGVYSAADALVLASSREGWANVLLEALACGTPVVASDIWGTPEVVCSPSAGVLVRERSPEAFAHAIRQLLAAPPSRYATRAYAEQFSWEQTTEGQLRLFRAVVAAHRSSEAVDRRARQVQ